MWYPKLRTQLKSNVPTASVDCGVRATQMGIEWLSKGDQIPSVSKIRDVGGMGSGPTNYYEWDTVIDELGGRKLGYQGVKTNSWDEVKDHLMNDGAAIVAVDYGEYRRLMQAKSGSLTFSGYHAILFVNSRRRDNTNQTRSFDSLLDGRYKGCPSSPVWVPHYKVRKSAEAVGRKEAGSPVIYAVNLFRDPAVAPIDPGDVIIPPDAPSILDVITDINQLGNDMDVPVDGIVDDLLSLVGVTPGGELEGDYIASGIKV
jgi:hypothetical protein